MEKIRIENFLTPFKIEAKVFVSLPLDKSRNFPPPPPVWIEKLTAMKQVCVAGKDKY